MQSLTDEGLVKSVLRGDENAFSQLYERYWQPIYWAAYRIIQNPEDAQDATQEIAFKLYKSLHQWDVQKSKLSTWIYKMTVNHSIDCHRVRRRRKESQLPENKSDQDSRFDVPDSSARSPFNEIENKAKVDAVLQYAGTFPDLQRQIFIDRYFNECKLEEIAVNKHCSLGTVKSSLHRATQAVRHFLRKSEASRRGRHPLRILPAGSISSYSWTMRLRRQAQEAIWRARSTARMPRTPSFKNES
jgi:RNA polymerase sigma-70 factor (ECF subfamily)